MRWIGLLTAAMLWLAAPVAGATTVDELIAKNIKAKGGIDKIRAIETLRLSGKIRFGGGGFTMEMDFVGLTKRSGKLRTEASMQGLTAITAYDGTVGWQIQPFRGRRDPEKLPGDELKSLALRADMDGPLIDYKAKGHKIAYLGTEDVDGTEAHKLKIQLKNGNVRFVFLDPDYFLEIRVIDQMKIRGVQIERETDLGNYERINGVYIPFSIESGKKGGPKNQIIEIDKAEANVKLKNALFQCPKPRAPKAN
jgi:hypothetical protein